MVKVGETPINPEYDARIIVDIVGDSFVVMHSNNIDLGKVYLIFLAAIDYMEGMSNDMKANDSKYLN